MNRKLSTINGNYVTISVMKQAHEQGNVVVIVLLVVLLAGAAAFGVWAFQSRQDYKNHADQKALVAVQAARSRQAEADQAKYEQLEKQPFRTYKGPEAFGSITVQYPKTWSSYVDETSHGSTVLDGYFYPGTVPAISADSSTFALRLQVLSQNYSDVVGNLSGLGSRNGPRPRIAPYALPKVSSVVGVRVDGPLADGKTGSLIVLPLRDKTLELSSEAPQFLNDFNNNILPNLTFSP